MIQGKIIFRKLRVIWFLLKLKQLSYSTAVCTHDTAEFYRCDCDCKIVQLPNTANFFLPTDSFLGHFEPQAFQTASRYTCQFD